MIPTNTAYIYQKHYLTDCARVAAKDQRKQGTNYVVITEGSFSGVYQYPAEILNECGRVMNGKLVCYCVPYTKMEKIRELDEVQDKDFQKKVNNMHKKWKEKPWAETK